MPGSAVAGILVLDLDGTLCLGDAPVLRYARHAFADRPEAPAALARLEAFLAHDGTGGPLGDPVLAGARDGYQAVAALAAELEVPREDLAAAFRRARAEAREWEREVAAPPGAAELLDELGAAGVRRALVTNSPGTGLGPLLETLGLRARLDRAVNEARKPAGMPEALDRLQREAPAALLASLGDIWENDHAEVRARGGATFLIDRHGLGDGAPTARAPRAHGLYDAIREWAATLPV